LNGLDGRNCSFHVDNKSNLDMHLGLSANHPGHLPMTERSAVRAESAQEVLKPSRLLNLQ